MALETRQDYLSIFRQNIINAEKGDSRAAANLGNLYLNGLGVPRDYVQAAQWFQKSADMGNPLGKTKLALLYLAGWGVEKSEAKAFLLFREAAEGGFAPAQITLGELYFSGRGTEVDFKQAYFWYSLALSRDPEQEKKMDVHGKILGALATRLSHEDMMAIQEDVRDWKPFAKAN